MQTLTHLAGIKWRLFSSVTGLHYSSHMLHFSSPSITGAIAHPAHRAVNHGPIDFYLNWLLSKGILPINCAYIILKSEGKLYINCVYVILKSERWVGRFRAIAHTSHYKLYYPLTDIWFIADVIISLPTKKTPIYRILHYYKILIWWSVKRTVPIG